MKFGRKLFVLLFVLMLVNQVLRSPVSIFQEWERGMLWVDGFHSVLYQRSNYDVGVLEKKAKEVKGKQKPPLVLLPDLGDPISSWRDVISGVPEDRTIQMIEYFGQGDSVFKEDSFYFASFDQMLFSIVDDGSKPVILLGHGLGGWLAIRFATQYPELVDRVIVINPSGFEQGIELPKTIEETTEHLEVMLGKQWNFRFVLRNWLDLFDTPLLEVMKEEMVLEGKLSREERALERKLFILWGEQDPRSTEQYRSVFQEHFSKASVSSLKDGYHSPQFTHPQKVQEFLLSSLD